MTDNPLLLKAQVTRRRGKVTVEMLHEQADNLNRSGWVRASGLPYFVNQQPDTKNGGVQHFLDRKAHRS